MPLLRSATGRCFAAYEPGPAIAPLLQDASAVARQEPRTALPLTAQAVDDMLADVRARGMARAVDGMLPALAGSCAPVFDCEGRLVPGLLALGSIAHFDAGWNGRVARLLHAAAARRSADLGHSG